MGSNNGFIKQYSSPPSYRPLQASHARFNINWLALERPSLWTVESISRSPGLKWEVRAGLWRTLNVLYSQCGWKLRFNICGSAVVIHFTYGCAALFSGQSGAISGEFVSLWLGLVVEAEIHMRAMAATKVISIMLYCNTYEMVGNCISVIE